MNYTAVIDDNLVHQCKGISFGRYPYPPEEAVMELKNNKYTIFIDLTGPRDQDKVISYQRYLSDDTKYYHYPIQDRSPPNKESFTLFIRKIIDTLSPADKIYVHCRGGHGRAGLDVCVLLMELNPNLSPGLTLRIVYESHQKRPLMNDRWRKMGSPQTRSQKSFVEKYK